MAPGWGGGGGRAGLREGALRGSGEGSACGELPGQPSCGDLGAPGAPRGNCVGFGLWRGPPAANNDHRAQIIECWAWLAWKTIG